MSYTFQTISDKNRWNSFLESVPKTKDTYEPFSFIQSYEWLEFQKSIGREIYPLGIYQGDSLIGVAAGVVIRAKRGSYLYIRNGPVVNWTDKELVPSLFKHLKVYAKQRKLWFIRISPLITAGTPEESMIKSLNLPRFPMNDVEALDTYVMDIASDEETLISNIKKKTRYEIRKAEKLCKVLVTEDSKYIDDFYVIEEDTVQRNDWNAYSKDYIRKEFETFAREGKATIVLVSFEGKNIAGGIFVHFGAQTYYHYGASLTAYRHIPGSYLVLWEAIKAAKEKGSEKFNFWGITYEGAKDSHPWTGLTQFKMKFPGEIRRYISARDIPISPLYWLTNMYERIDKHRKGY